MESLGVMQLEKFEVSYGQQVDFTFKPEATREYKVQTVGISDSRVVIFEERDNEPRHFASEDDSVWKGYNSF